MKKLLTIFLLCLTFSAFSQGQLQQEATGTIQYASGKLMQLAEAIPADKYSWAPADDVRSVADVYAHLISANYFFASKLGAQIPAGVNMQTLEQELDEKAEITKALKESFDLVTKAVQEAKDETLSEKVEYPFPGEFTNMSSILIIMTHTNEHLGQLIAYARMNDITPPWSTGGAE